MNETWLFNFKRYVYRYLLIILALISLGFAIWKLPPIYLFLAVLGDMFFLVFFWLLGNLFTDVTLIRGMLEETQRISLPGDETLSLSQSTSSMTKKNALPLDVSGIQPVGDRVFKVDSKQTCVTCSHYDPTGRFCQTDGASLKGVTVAALGCQYYISDESPVIREGNENNQPDSQP